jgi:hypothetical protein
LIVQRVGDRISVCDEGKMKVPGLTGNLHCCENKVAKRITRICQLYLSFQGGGFFASGRYPLRRFAPLVKANFIRIDKIHGLYFTEPDTLRIAVTEVAFEDLSVGGIKTHGTERACADT